MKKEHERIEHDATKTKTVAEIDYIIMIQHGNNGVADAPSIVRPISGGISTVIWWFSN